MNIWKFGTLICALGFCANVGAQEPISYDITTGANVSSGDFAPYLIGSLNHGKVTQKNTVFSDISVIKSLDTDKRFSWGFGAEMILDAASADTYSRYCAESAEWVDNPRRPSYAILQQLYVELKYRSIFIQAGMKEHTPVVLNPELSSGDFVESGNARPIPEVRAGFYDYVDIPFTNGWLQVQLQLAFGAMTDYNYMADRYNYYNYHIASNTLYNYKSCLFRTSPEAPFMAVFGMQSGGFFGGKTKYYDKGVLTHTDHFSVDAMSFVNMIVPGFNSKETFSEGSSLGSWDFFGVYSFRPDRAIAGYFQWPIEDGSGVAKRNKIDGVWGIEYIGGEEDVVSNVVVEYVDYRDQSGPIHFAPGDMNSTTITMAATGNDNYYNNAFYNSYANYGMSIGTPFLKSPLYNLDGYPAFMCTRANGMHLGVSGYISDAARYKFLFSYQRGLGSYILPFSGVKKDVSLMLEVNYDLSEKLRLNAKVAADKGELRGNNFGALLSLSYIGTLNSR